MEYCALCGQPHSIDHEAAGRHLAAALAALFPCMSRTAPGHRPAGVGAGTLAEAERRALAAVAAQLEQERTQP
jgi:hypothetical protein